MSNMPFISVIIPVYNTQQYVSKCLDSVLSQTLKNIEVICINDGSVDKSLSILKDYAHKDQRIQVIDQANQGAAVARNVGIQKSCAEFIIFMDSDDYYPENDVLETLYNTAKENDQLICGGELEYFDEQGKKYDNSAFVFQKEGIIDYIDYQQDYGYTRFIFNRELLEKNNIQFPAYKCFEDPVFFVQAMLASKTFYALKKTVYAYRTSHKTPVWNADMIIDNLKGFQDNLKISSINNLNKMHARTLNHLQNDWFSKPIREYVVLGNQDVLDQLNIVLNSIQWQWADISKKDLERELGIVHKETLLNKVFSVRKSRKHKIYTFLGVKVKIRLKKVSHQ